MPGLISELPGFVSLGKASAAAAQRLFADDDVQDIQNAPEHGHRDHEAEYDAHERLEQADRYDQTDHGQSQNENDLQSVARVHSCSRAPFRVRF